MVRLKTYEPNKPTKASFYIQSKGLHAGRPLKNPIANCFCVITNETNVFELVYALYIGKLFNYLLIGSVIPFIRIKEAESLINEYLPKANIKMLLALDKINQLVDVSQKKLNTAIQMRQAFALKAIQ